MRKALGKIAGLDHRVKLPHIFGYRIARGVVLLDDDRTRDVEGRILACWGCQTVCACTLSMKLSAVYQCRPSK